MRSALPRRAFFQAAALVPVALSAPHIARAAKRTLRIGQNNSEDSHYGQGAHAFAVAMAADPLLADTIRVEVHGGSELGDEISMLKDCAQGLLDMQLCSGSVLSNVVKEVGLLNAPYLFRDVGVARAVLDGPVGAGFAPLVAARNLRLLAWGENGLRHVTANAPVRTPADFKGLKIRVPQSAVMLGAMRALGAAPMTIGFNELRAALQTGQCDAQENPIVTILAARLYEMQKCLNLTGHIYDPAAFIASADVIEDLSEAQHQALIAAARKGAAATRAVAAAAEQSGIQKLAAAGMTVISDVDYSGLRAACRPYLLSLGESYGQALLQQLMTAGA
jgi:tripartite ATP-independent transporter DctP family solute receptor